MAVPDNLNPNTVLPPTYPSPTSRYDFSSIIGHCPAMQKVYSLMDKIVDSGATVLLRGDTGTGKEVVARAIHANSHRNAHKFVVQNCAALPENLLESELFGYKKGAFSGAVSDKMGLIEMADGGTLFLDEIGDMPMGLQAKLLRVLQDKTVRPLGSNESTGKLVNVRFIAATHQDLKAKIVNGEFREDLFYRLCVFPIDLPSLRQRREDIPSLLQYFLNQFSQMYNKSIREFAAETMIILQNYAYPGNIRDLRNIVERAVILCDAGTAILPEHLTEEIYQAYTSQQHKQASSKLSQNDTLKEKIEKYEAYLIKKKLLECQGNQTQAANELNIARRTIIEKINRYNITRKFKSIDILNLTSKFYSS